MPFAIGCLLTPRLYLLTFSRYSTPKSRAHTHTHSHTHRHTLQVILYSVPCNALHWTDNDVIMSSLVNTGNCKLGHDCRRVFSHRRHDETVASCEFVFTTPSLTRQNGFVASAVCIGHKCATDDSVYY